MVSSLFSIQSLIVISLPSPLSTKRDSPRLCNFSLSHGNSLRERQKHRNKSAILVGLLKPEDYHKRGIHVFAKQNESPASQDQVNTLEQKYGNSVDMYPCTSISDKISLTVQECERAIKNSDLERAVEAVSMLTKLELDEEYKIELDSEDESFPQNFLSQTALNIPFESETNETEIARSSETISAAPTVQLMGNLGELRDTEEQQKLLLSILNLGLSAENMSLVSLAYDSLRARGMLQTFGSFKPNESDIPRVVTPSVLKQLAGIEASQLSPKKWGSSNRFTPLLAIAIISALINNGVDVRPILVIGLVAAVLDSAYLGGTAFGQLLSLWKPYKRRILVHEAGHVLIAYLVGCPVRGVILDTSKALDVGIQGQAGTQFWDLTLEAELRSGQLTGASIDRYCMVLFGGIAAEALVYGEAEGGESDENMFKALVGQLQPVWSPAKISNQARWSVLQSYLLLKKHERTHSLLVDAMEKDAPLSELVAIIEKSVSGVSPS